MYGRLYIPTGRLDALYSTRLGTHWQLVAAAISERGQQSAQRAKNRRPDAIDHSNLLLNLQHDRGRWCSEYTWSAVDGLWGARVLYNFGKTEEVAERTKRREKRVDEEEAMEGGLKGRISAGAEIYFSAREKSGGGKYCIAQASAVFDRLSVSTALRFTTVPDANPPTQHIHEPVYTSQPPTTVTAVLNPILGHISAAYASRVSRGLAVCSRFDFNVYSYESEWTMGAEWWIRRPVAGSGVLDGQKDMPSDEPQGILKARISTNYVSRLSL